MSKKTKAVAEKPAVEKETLGRPSKYKPEYCQGLIDHMGAGLSFESFAAVIRVHRDTLFEWDKVHPEFSDAKKIAVLACQLFWENLGIKYILNESESFGEGQSKSTSLNSAVWIFNMKNRFKWRDKQTDEADQININFSLAEKMAKARARVGKAES